MKTAVSLIVALIVGGIVGLLVSWLLPDDIAVWIPFLLVVALVGVSYQVLYWLRRSD